MMPPPSRYIMIGGFLGAGKTTTLRRFGEYIQARGQRVGLITNDQGAGLVDTALTKSDALPTEEISGGCFCCRFSSLLQAARNLTATSRPEVFLAEPVGSCTDLVATVGLPLQQIYGQDFVVSPFSVLVDPIRAERIFGLQEGRKFSKNVAYIYRKQLEEADHILINKTDLLTPERLAALEEKLASEFPAAVLWRVNARTGDGLQPWFEQMLTHSMDAAKILDIDYDTYGQGEALLGWLNATATISGEAWDGNAFLTSLAEKLASDLAESGVEVAHLKMILGPSGDPMELAAVNLTRGDAVAELSHTLADPLDEAILLINCRAEGAPETLQSAVAEGLGAAAEEFGLTSKFDAMDFFRPGQPRPEIRIAALSSPT